MRWITMLAFIWSRKISKYYSFLYSSLHPLFLIFFLSLFNDWLIEKWKNWCWWKNKWETYHSFFLLCVDWYSGRRMTESAESTIILQIWQKEVDIKTKEEDQEEEEEKLIGWKNHKRWWLDDEVLFLFIFTTRYYLLLSLLFPLYFVVLLSLLFPNLKRILTAIQHQFHFLNKRRW